MKNNEVKGRTLEIIMAEANAKVDALNKERDFEKRISLEVEIDKLCKEYNSLSMLTVYAECRAEALPIMALAKACTYATISKKKSQVDDVIEGVVKKVDAYSLNESHSNLNILKYIKWLEERNFKMPKGWIIRMSAAKADIIDQWQAFDKAQDEHIFKIGQLKRLLQDMVNDMGFIEGEKGNNALRVTSAHARTMLKYANKKTGTQSGETLTPKIWDDLLMSVLNSIASGAAFENAYGGTAVFKEETATEEAPASEATTEAPAAAEEPKTEEVKAE